MNMKGGGGGPFFFYENYYKKRHKKEVFARNPGLRDNTTLSFRLLRVTRNDNFLMLTYLRDL